MESTAKEKGKKKEVKPEYVRFIGRLVNGRQSVRGLRGKYRRQNLLIQRARERSGKAADQVNHVTVTSKRRIMRWGLIVVPVIVVAIVLLFAWKD